MSPSPSDFVDGTSRAEVSSDVKYTCFVRLPFPRNSFEDPPPVQWDAAKDRALWKIIYKTSHSRDVDWEALSVRFGVSLSFLLQQAAWLMERHLESMRKQMQKLGAGAGASGGLSAMASVGGSAGPNSPLPDGPGDGRPGSSLGPNRPNSKFSTRRLSNVNAQVEKRASGEHLDGPSGSTTERPGYSRTPSTNTIIQSRAALASRHSPQPRFRGSNDSQRGTGRPARPIDVPINDDDNESAIEADESSDSDSDDDVPSMAKSQAFRRPPTSRKHNTMSTLDDDDEEEATSSGGFLPFAAATTKSTSTDPSATLRNSTRKQGLAGRPVSAFVLPSGPTESSASSASSATPASQIKPDDRTARRIGPLSPEQQAQLASLSPRSRRDKSDGSPSLGSSFSDLDDLSVTQSTLEEALMSAQQGQSITTSVVNRVSGFRDGMRNNR